MSLKTKRKVRTSMIWLTTNIIGTFIFLLLWREDNALLTSNSKPDGWMPQLVSYFIVLVVSAIGSIPIMVIYHLFRDRMLLKYGMVGGKVRLSVLMCALIIAIAYIPLLMFADLSGFGPTTSTRFAYDSHSEHLSKNMLYLLISYGTPFILWILSDKYRADSNDNHAVTSVAEE